MTTPDSPEVAASPASKRNILIAEIRELFLARVERAVRTAGISSAEGIAALRTGAAQLLDQMTTAGARTGFALANSLTASQIRLVDDNQLELSIRLGDMSKRLRDECAGVQYKFHQRFVTLLDRPSLRLGDNPLSPDSVCRALADMFGVRDQMNVNPLQRLADIEHQLAGELPLLYAELTELLVRHEIAPARMHAVPAEARATPRRRGGERDADASGDAMAALQQAVLAKIQVPGSAISMLVAGGDTAPRFEQVMGQLDQWQAQDQSDLFDGSAEELVESALHALKSSEAMARLRAQDTVALDVLSALFDAVFEDSHLSPAIKAAVARMQIPVLKAAILGATFFTDPEHPARAMLEAMGEATIGLGPDVPGTHPVCIELQRIAAGIQSEFQRDNEVFARYGAELESFMARRNHELQNSAQSFIALAKSQEQLDLAARAAWRLVASRTVSVAPRIVADFLREHWTEVLTVDYFDGGQGGQRWHDDEAALDDLLWSIQPKSDAEERRRLGQMVPGLLARIKAGLDRIGVQAEARAPFLDACFTLQAAAIRGRTIDTAPGHAASDVADAELLTESQADGVTLKVLRSANPDARASGDIVRDLVIGDWVEFQLPGEAVCGRLCWVSPELGNPVFMNSAWDCAISVARPILERQLAAGQASSGSTLSFFANAIEKALHRNIPAKAP